MHTTRVLAFPLCAAAVLALDGCQGISINDPSVRACRAPDTTEIVVRLPNGAIARDTMIVTYNQTRCRKAA